MPVVRPIQNYEGFIKALQAYILCLYVYLELLICVHELVAKAPLAPAGNIGFVIICSDSGATIQTH